MQIIASGGISSLEDIRNLKEIEKDGLAGVIVGKALYEKRFTLKEALEIA
jgi:phosphoribosylformimino-5-aminoimidazole carboxamide ribotide isomerase